MVTFLNSTHVAPAELGTHLGARSGSAKPLLNDPRRAIHFNRRKDASATIADVMELHDMTSLVGRFCWWLQLPTAILHPTRPVDPCQSRRLCAVVDACCVVAAHREHTEWARFPNTRAVPYHLSSILSLLIAPPDELHPKMHVHQDHCRSSNQTISSRRVGIVTPSKSQPGSSLRSQISATSKSLGSGRNYRDGDEFGRRDPNDLRVSDPRTSLSGRNS